MAEDKLFQDLNDLYRCALDTMSLQRVIQLARPNLGNPIIMPDAFNKVIAKSEEAETINDSFWNMMLEPTTSFQAQSIARREGLEEMFMANGGKTKIHSHPALQHRWIFSRVYVGIVSYTQVAVVEYYRPFTDDDIQIVNCINRIAAHLLQISGLVPYRNRQEERMALSSILNGDSVFSADAPFFVGLDWTEFQSLRVIVVVPRNYLMESREYQPDIQWLEQHMAGLICVLDQYGVVALHKAARQNDMSSFANEYLTNYLKKQGYIMGVSRAFSAPELIPEAHAQARAAAQICANDNAYVCRTYDEIYLQQLFRRAANSCTCFSSLHHIARQIHTYDNEHGTSYINDLFAYLSSHRSINKMAAALGIHRNTANYRINRINDLFTIDYESEEELFALEFSLRLLLNKGTAK